MYAPPRLDEAQAVAQLHALGVLDKPPAAALQVLVETVSRLFGAPIAQLTLLDAERLCIHAKVGTQAVSMDRKLALCAHTVLAEGVFVVPDARVDARFADHPQVAVDAGLRFYAGAPLRTRAGHALGALCVIDREARELSVDQEQMLLGLAAVASQILESEDAMRQLERTTQNLRASESHYEALCEGLPVGIYRTDARSHMLYTNPRLHQVLSLGATQLQGRAWLQAMHPDDVALVRDTWLQALASGADYKLTHRIRRSDGTVRSVHVQARAEAAREGHETTYLGTVEDITDKLDAERALDSQHRRLAYMIEATHVGTFEWNVQSGELRLNERWAGILGRQLAELGPLSKQTWIDHAHPDDLAMSNRKLSDHFAGREPRHEVEVRMRHRQGHWVWVLVRGQVMSRTLDGKPEWMYGTHQDMSSWHEREDSLRKSKNDLDLVARLTQTGGWRFDLRTQELELTDQARAIYGLPTNQTVTVEALLDHHGPDERRLLMAAFERCMRDGTPYDMEVMLLRADGGRRWVRAVGEADLENGIPVCVAGALQDVTDRVRERQALQQARERVSLATDSGGIGIWDLDLATGAVAWDKTMLRLFGVSEDTPSTYELWRSLVHPEDLAQAEADLHAALAGTRAFDSEFRLVRPDGAVRNIRGAARVTRDAQGQAVSAVGANWDITEMRSLHQQLSGQHELLRVTLQSIGDAVITTDAVGNVDWLNPVAERLTGWTSASAHGRRLDDVLVLVHQDTREAIANPAVVGLAAGETVSLDAKTVLVAQSGEEFGIEHRAAPIRDRHGASLGVVLVFRDVTEERRQAGEISFRARHDALTGLVNRAEFDTRLRNLLDRARGDASTHTLLFIDLDQFKIVNDTCGHPAGDQLLKQVAGLLGERVRARDTLARLGGDEFGVILEHCALDHGQRVAQQICDAMEAYRFLHEGQRFRVGTSIGLVPFDQRWASVAAAQQAADTACYAAKEGGRNRVHVWFDTDASMQARQGQTQWATRLEQALDEDLFVLHAQRIVPVTEAAPIGVYAEVLIRLQGDDGRLIPPGAFLPAAERFRLASRIDRWVLRHAIDWMKRCSDLNTLRHLGVNLSGQSVGDPEFQRWATELLRAAGPAISRKLCLEITETAAVTNLARAASFVKDMRATGVTFALDDFGSGVSSFGYLKELQVDFLKIDGQFIRDLVTDPLDEAAVRCFVEVARVVGLRTIAEFVDQPAVLARLGELGVDFAQGYLLHQPEPLNQLMQNVAVSA